MKIEYTHHHQQQPLPFVNSHNHESILFDLFYTPFDCLYNANIFFVSMQQHCQLNILSFSAVDFIIYNAIYWTNIIFTFVHSEFYKFHLFPLSDEEKKTRKFQVFFVAGVVKIKRRFFVPFYYYCHWFFANGGRKQNKNQRKNTEKEKSDFHFRYKWSHTAYESQVSSIFIRFERAWSHYLIIAHWKRRSCKAFGIWSK